MIKVHPKISLRYQPRGLGEIRFEINSYVVTRIPRNTKFSLLDKLISFNDYLPENLPRFIQKIEVTDD
jgi:hypothetical protein